MGRKIKQDSVGGGERAIDAGVPKAKNTGIECIHTKPMINDIDIARAETETTTGVEHREREYEHGQLSGKSIEWEYNYFLRRQRDKDNGLNFLSVSVPMADNSAREAIADTLKRVRGGSSSRSMSYSFDGIVGDRVKEVPQELQNEMRGWQQWQWLWLSYLLTMAALTLKHFHRFLLLTKMFLDNRVACC